MRCKIKVAMILAFICIAFLITVLIINVDNKIHVDGWNDFKKAAQNNYSFIKDVNLSSITPPDIRISYSLNRKIEMEEVDKIFIYTRNYLLSEKVFKDLQRLHSEKFNYSFRRINIILSYRDNNSSFNCKIFSSQDVEGDPNHNNFKTWDIEFNDELAKEYKPSR